MEPQNITISKMSLVGELEEGAAFFGLRGWGIYFNRLGELDLRHAERVPSGWIKLYDLQNFIEWEDENGKNADDDSFDARGVAEHIIEKTSYRKKKPPNRMVCRMLCAMDTDGTVYEIQLT